MPVRLLIIVRKGRGGEIPGQEMGASDAGGREGANGLFLGGG